MIQWIYSCYGLTSRICAHQNGHQSGYVAVNSRYHFFGCFVAAADLLICKLTPNLELGFFPSFPTASLPRFHSPSDSDLLV